MRTISVSLFCFLILILSCTNIQKTCILKGELVNYKFDTILLVKSSNISPLNTIKIPINKSTIDFEFGFSDIEAYNLVLNRGETASSLSFTFFPKNGNVRFDIDMDRKADNNSVKGGIHNRMLMRMKRKRYKKFNKPLISLSDSINELIEKGLAYNDDYKSILEQIDKETDRTKLLKLYRKRMEYSDNRTHFKDDYLPLIYRIDSLERSKIEWMHDYEEQNYSLISYKYFLERTKGLWSDTIEDLDDFWSPSIEFKNRYPNHPYNDAIEVILHAKEKITIGGNYIDFELPDLTGQVHSLSSLIEGKIALIDCWYSWCSPCIKKSKETIPIYDEFHAQGFTVIGIAANDTNIKEILDRINMEQYPWINLIEFKRQNSIWDKYNLSNFGGGRFLLDRDGKILAINPATEELRRLLAELL